MTASGWTPTLPPLSTTLWLAPVLLGSLAAAAASCGWLKRRRGLPTGYTRKLFHFFTFTLAALLGIRLGFPAVNLLGAAACALVLFVLQRGEGNLLYEAIARESDRPHRSLYVVLPLAATALGGIVSGLLFGAFSIVGYAVTGWADALAEPVGLRFGKHPYRVPGLGLGVSARRTLEGSAAVFAASLLAVLAVFSATALPLKNPAAGFLLLAALVVAAVSAIVEAVSHHGLDNFTLQVAASAAAWALARWAQGA